ncbi:MAG: permease [Pseudomonadota bacterium]
MQRTSAAGSLGWFAHHEFNLSWRDFSRMMTAGKPGREKAVIAIIAFAFLVLHAIAYLFLKPQFGLSHQPDKLTLITLTGCALLTFSLMMSQAMELVTRVFYSRSDLDLVLSSPVSEKKVFAIRIGSIALTTTFLSTLMFGAAINVMAIFNGVQWLAGYLVLIALGAIATALSLGIVIFMFRTIGAKRTRLVSQIVAAVVGAGFIIGIQIGAITSLNSVSRLALFQSEALLDAAPSSEHPVWLLSKAIMGHAIPLLITLLVSFGLLLAAIIAFAGRFGEDVLAAASISQSKRKSNTKTSTFSKRSMRASLRNKEWKLLLRDHWLISQSLMQILYLAPPALMLWQGFGSEGAMTVVALPVLVMASGQLAGGLAWLAISGEDAPQLVQTAPIARGSIIRAKIEAVLGAIGFLVSPILILVAFLDLKMMLYAAAGVGLASVSATMIQLWFRSQANRASFRRRQTSSKVATLSEAFSSIMWAGATGLAAADQISFAIVACFLALVVLWIARSFRPTQEF